jgi:hypothetical protein
MQNDDARHDWELGPVLSGSALEHQKAAVFLHTTTRTAFVKALA